MSKTQDKLTRIAIVSNDKCKPKKCRQECKKSCPVVRMGKLVFILKSIVPKKNICVYCHMSKKSRVGRSAIIFFFFFLTIGKTGNSRFRNPIPVFHFRNFR